MINLKFYFLIWVFFVAVPDQPPAEINATASSSTSITVTWSSVPSGHENGIITGYRVLYIDQANSQPKLNVTVDADISYIELKDLLVYTNYCVEVLAFTGQGDGIRSPCVNASTGESGKDVISSGCLWQRQVAKQTVNNSSWTTYRTKLEALTESDRMTKGEKSKCTLANLNYQPC